MISTYKVLNTQCFRRRFHKYGFGKDLKSNGSGQGMFQIKAYIHPIESFDVKIYLNEGGGRHENQDLSS